MNKPLSLEDALALPQPSVGKRGRPGIPLEFSIERELTVEDLARAEEGAPTVEREIAKIKALHHRIAYLLASGEQVVTISAMVGVSPARIQQMKNAPAFKELTVFYENQQKEILADTMSNLKLLGDDTIAELSERLADAPAAFTAGALIDIAKLTLDRSGFGPTATQVNIDAPLSPEQTAALIAEAEERQHGNIKVIDGRAEEVPSPSAASEDNQPEESRTLKQPLGENVEG